MIQHVHERVCRARLPDRVLVATDDERIAAAVRAFGGEALMTSAAHQSGTDRLAEAAAATAAEIVVNVQGDEPMIDPRVVDAVIAPFQDPSVEMTTAATALRDLAEREAASVVKVVTDAAGDALFFSRSPIPHVPAARGGPAAALALARRHLGIYAYRLSTLLRLAALRRSPLEEAEGLEQLRALHNGIRIRVVAVEADEAAAVDTAEDLERVRSLMARRAVS
jgi:3-deoxy-manno-octulosonate cytidylyltransferase (CMP-KDO synthetase)